MWRRWRGVDDASGYAGLPVEWPHDERDCPACTDLRKMGPREVRSRSGTWYVDWDSRGAEANEILVQYPKRARALIDHQSAVRRSGHFARLKAKATPPSE